MATLREYLTPAEQQRFKSIYNQGYFNQITFNRFLERFQSEIRYLDYRTKELDRARKMPWSPQRASSPEALKTLFDKQERQFADARRKAFDNALSDSLRSRERRARQDFEIAFVDPDLIGDFTREHFQKHGLIGGSAEIAESIIKTPFIAAENLAAGRGLGEDPYEGIASIGSLVPLLRMGARLGSISRTASGVGRGVLPKIADSRLWRHASHGIQAADIIGADEELGIELLAEGAIEGIGFGGDVIRDLKSGRMRHIFQGMDPQAASDAQTTQATTEHDNITGSRTSPGLSPDAARAAERAAADSAVESADAQVALDTATQQRQGSLDQQLRREAWERMLIEAEEREAAEAEQAAIEQSFIDQDDAYTQQQVEAEQAAAEQQSLEAEKIEFTRAWLPFYSDLAGGSQSEGIRLLNAEYDAGVRNPIAHRYDQIAAGLQQQMGVVPSELHREADRRLRQQIGEKWYNIYRGIDQRPTPQQRAQRAAEAADDIVEGTDEQPTVDGQGDAGISAGADSAVGGDVATGTDVTGTDPAGASETPEDTETIPEARIGPETVGYQTDAVTAHRVRPVLGDLDDVIPSHTPTGEKREDYPQELQPRKTRGGPSSLRLARKRAENPNINQMLTFPGHFRDGPPLTSKKHIGASISGSGRRMTAEIMRDEYPENYEKYQQALRVKLEELGMDPAEADAIAAAGGSPFLYYELIDDIDEVELAKDSNKKTTQGLTASELAESDTEFFDAELMGLWQQPGNEAFGEALLHTDNAPFRKALMDRIPDEIISEFMTEDEDAFSNDGIKRLENAIIMYVFQGQGTPLATALIQQGLPLKNIEHFLRTAIASLAYAKANGQDISTDMAAAVFRFLDLNKTADELASERKKPKEPLLYGAIEALYRSPQLIDGLTLLEKQILYLIYSKRDAYTQLAEMFQEWSKTAVSKWIAESGQQTLIGDTVAPQEVSAGVFARIIRDYIRETIFETRETREGQTVLVSPDSLPPELVDLREDMDAMSEAADKERFAKDWIDAFLRVMNEGEAQTEVDIDATQTEAETAVGGTTPADTGTPRGTSENQPQGTPDRTDTGAPATPESQRGVAPAQPRGTDSDAVDTTQGDPDSVSTDDQGSDLAIEEALQIASAGTVSLDEWNAADTDGKRSFLQKQEQAIPVHLQTGAITAEQAEQKRDAIAHLRQSIQQQEATDADTTEGTEIDTVETDQDVSQGEAAVDTAEVPPTETEEEVLDSREPVASVPPLVQRDLDTLGVTAEEWEQIKANDEVSAFINALSREQQEQIEWGTNLIDDANRTATGVTVAAADAAADADEDTDFDDDYFGDVKTGTLRDITDQQRSDFDVIRRKSFLGNTIRRLEAKGRNRTAIETATLRALTASQRTDAQQGIYETELQKFIDRTVARLQAKDSRSTTENRILETLVAVQAEGLPEEASELSLYADLDTPDQTHSSPLAETRTLAGVQAPATADTQLNLPEDVTADTTKLSPAQQTSVKAIVAAFLRKIHTTTDTTVQGGFLLGDKPGVGKTRQALATIWHYMRAGINKHFVLAPKQELLNNYSRDMQAMGGPAGDISNYNADNQQVSTPIGTATYAMLIRKPNLTHFTTRTGNQNAIADIVEHLTGARPTLQQTHPETYQATLEAYRRILSNVQTPTVENVVNELRRQAGTVNLNNPANVQQFRQRLTPVLADLLLAERTQDGQQEMFEGSLLEERAKQLLTFAETHLAAQPDPDFQAKASRFEGVIVLDEMHQTAGVDSQIGQMIATLHALLPNAKFLYMSATPFKEIDNFWIAERLGLWGANQPFPTFGHFARAFKRAARAVKEIVPLHLKQIGRYISRALSSKATRYTPVEIPLTETEKRQYDTAVALVQGIRQRFVGAIDAAERSPWGSIIGKRDFGKYRGHYMKMYYNTMQKFFLALLDAMKAQGLEENIREKLLAGDKVIVQLENTWEKVITGAKERGKTGTIGPFDLLIDFVENEKAFPVHEYTTEQRVNERTGKTYTVVIPRMEYNAEGEQVRVIDPNLKRLQTQLIEALRQEMQKSVFTAGLPFAADIIHTIALEAGATSAEISGRSEIYPRDNPQRMPQDTAARDARTEAFSETTDLDLIVLGPAGLTGINLPISEKIKDKVGGLFHYLVQSSWNVNTFEQGLGRGKRANSAIDPHYMIAHQDLPGADRVLGATLAKFAEMGALAGQADNALMQNIGKVEGETNLDDDPEADANTDDAGFDDVFDEEDASERPHIFGIHGREALAQLWLDIYNSGDFELVDRLGLTRPEEAGGTGIIDPQTIPTVQQFFSRLLHESTTDQPRFYQQFERILKRIIARQKDLRQLDTGASDLDYADGLIADRLTIYTDPDTGQMAEMVRVNVKKQLQQRSWEFLQKVVRGEPGYEHYGGNRFEAIYKDEEGHVWAVFEHPFSEDGEVVYTRWGPRGAPVEGLHQGQARITEEELTNNFERMTTINDNPQARIADLEEVKQLWEAEDSSADTDVDTQIFMATGLILPKWIDLSWRNPITGRPEPPVMGIIPMLDGSHLHGRVIPSGMLTEVLTQIGGVDPNYFDSDTQQQTAVSNQQTPDTDIDIPAIVRDIIGEQTDTRVAQRLEKIVEHIHKNLPLRLRGHRVRTAAEAALLGQLIRDPQVEHTWIVYRKNDRIVKIEPMSLSRKGETKAGDFAHIKREAGRLQADAILRIHNHPSGIAEWSQPDKDAAMNWHKELGTLMAEDIIVDSGTYAYRTFENGEYTWHGGTELDPSVVDWATGAFPWRDVAGGFKRTDPLYQNPLIRGAREAAAYMLGIKHASRQVTELIYVDTRTGKIVDTSTDTTLQQTTDPAQYLQSALVGRKGQHVHITMWAGDPSSHSASVSLAQSLHGVDGVDSVWVNAERVTGSEHIGQDPDNRTQDTTTKNIGGQTRRFVRVDDSNLSDPSTPDTSPIRKSFIVAGVERDLTTDPRREDPFMRTVGDAEHIVSAKRRLDVERLDPTALENARRVIEAGIQQFTAQNTDSDANIEKIKAEIANKQAYKDALNNLNFRSARTIGDLLQAVESTPALQTDEVKALFQGLDPATERWDTGIFRQLSQLSGQAADSVRSLSSELDTLEKKQEAAAEVGRVANKIGPLHTALNAKTAYHKALDALTWKHAGADTKTIQDVLDFIAETPALQTDEVKALFQGIDPTAETWRPDGLLEKMQNLKSQAWDDMRAINEQLRDIRSEVSSYEARAILDLMEEINQSHRMSVDRVEQGVRQLPESTQVAIEPALDKLWGHISTEAGVLDTVLESGFLKALSPTGDPDINEGMLAYLSWSSYYRRSKGFHNNGVILDLELVLDEIPNITGTVHVRNDWGERMELANSAEIRQAMETWKDTNEDIVIEIRIPQDVDINKYLIGIIEDSKVYVEAGQAADPDTQIDQSFLDKDRLSDYTAQVQRTNPDSVVYRVHAPKDLSMQGRGRARTAEIGEKALNTFIDSNAGIMKVLRAWSPTSRKWARMAKNTFVSGFGKLTDLEAPEGSDAPSPADVLKEILRERQHISKLNAGRVLSTLEPHLLAFNKLARKRVNLRTTAAAPGTRKATRTAMSHKVWNFIEYDTPIEKDPQLLAIAKDLKEAWRELLIHDTQKIVELMDELETINEKLYATDAQGKRIEWYGESFDGFEWDAENRGYVKDGKTYTIEEAHRAANKLYMPHYFRGKSPLQEYSALQKHLDALNELLARDDVSAEDLQRFEIEYNDGTYTHTPTGHTATTPYEMVRIVSNYLSSEDAALQGILNYYEDEGRVGFYGHLERTRETDDRFYARDISLMAENRVRLWDRLAEVAVIGQQHPLLGDSPRMKTLIEQVLNFDKTPRETALRKVIEALNSGQEGMFQRLPQFATGVDVALDIMQHWLERDADGEKTGNYQEIDIGRMNLDDDTLSELERIGLIEKAEVDAEVSDTSASTSGDRWKVVGENIEQRHATMARFMHEFYSVLAERKQAVHALVLGLGNWHTRDPLEMESAEFWKKINDTITVLTLNHGVAIQNLLEIPLISMMTGANPLFKGLKNMSNKEYRNAMQQLARGLSHARKFMADTSLADKYLGSPLTFFSKSDEFSRAAGLGIGLENAKEKIQQYAEATDPKKKAAIRRDMDAVRLNKEVIDSIPAEQLQRVLEAAEQHILNNEVDTVFSSEKGGELSPAERLAGTMLRSMFYVSDETFKQYDASSLPQFMVSRNPLIRVFMKYKSWMLQQNRLVYNQLRRAARETKKGNLRPLGDFIAATAMMGLGTGGLLWVYSLLQGDDDDKAWQERLFKGLAAAQAFGIASVMFELAMYAEGNWYQMSNLLAKQAAGPTFSVAAQMIGPVLTGDFGRAGEEALRRLPIVSFSRRVGGWRLLEEATGTGEEE